MKNSAGMGRCMRSGPTWNIEQIILDPRSHHHFPRPNFSPTRICTFKPSCTVRARFRALHTNKLYDPIVPEPDPVVCRLNLSSRCYTVLCRICSIVCGDSVGNGRRLVTIYMRVVNDTRTVQAGKCESGRETRRAGSDDEEVGGGDVVVGDAGR